MVKRSNFQRRAERTTLILFGVFSLFFSLYTSSTVADVIFEGYAKINAGSKQIGYYVQRYEFDPKKKQFISLNFIRTNPAGGDITESLKAVANDKFQPVSYQYTSKVGDRVKVIDAEFKGKTMNFIVSDGASKNTFTRKLPEGTFLSTFLQYLMLQNGYKVGKKFVYSAISEEDGEVHQGEALIKEEMKLNDVDGFRVLNQFKNSQFISFITPKGEVLGTVSPLQDISTELVSRPEEAITGQMVQNKTLSLLFGKVPEGKKNILAKKKSDAIPNETKAPTAPAATNPPPAEADKKEQ